jgi:hypothetical protein
MIPDRFGARLGNRERIPRQHVLERDAAFHRLAPVAFFCVFSTMRCGKATVRCVG